MIDFARITARAGDGGNGSGSFHHIKGKRYGKADGGNGGSGGNVYCEATGDLNTLEKYRYVKDYRAGNGGNGLSNHRRGAQGDDLLLLVPVGTQVRFGESVSQRISGVSESVSQKSESPSHRITDSPNHRLTESPKHGAIGITYDLVVHGQKILVARGGEGGRGNSYLRDEFGRRPRVGEKGQEGERVQITLELKLIADVGLIGLPNVGKSTLLSKLTKAQPKIADYPFTTLEPNLGVLSVNQWVSGSVGQKSESPNHRITELLVLADIPGLIEGASQGKGLGDLFLRHIERTRVLAHLIDVSVNQWVSGSVSQKSESPNHRVTESPNHRVTDTPNLWQNYQTVRNELRVYSKELAKKKEIIVLTKIDLVNKKIIDEAIVMFKNKRKKVVAISAQSGQGLEYLIKEILRYI